MKKFLLIAAGFLMLQCNKSKDFNDLAGSYTLKGVVVIRDTLNGPAVNVVAPNMKVYLKYPHAVSGYIYSTTADGLAQYSFNGIGSDSGYTVYAYTDTGTVKYYGELLYGAGTIRDRQSDTLRLYPDSNTQNVLHLLVRDSTSATIPNVTAWVFNSPVLFAADTSAGRIFDMPVNGYGIANKYNLAPGTYYLRVKTRIGGLNLAGESNVDIDATGIKTAIITLKSTPIDRNGLELTLMDPWNTPVGAATAYFYRSRSVYLLDTLYNNSQFKLVTDDGGFASAYILPAAKYYFKAIKIIGKDTLTATDSFNVPAQGIDRKTKQMQ